ncbi:14279_t:CDS:2, partial [Entrophospora sp. SA101]
KHCKEGGAIPQAATLHQLSVVNTLFAYHNNTKLVSVDFLARVNNVTMGQTLINILPKYDIPITSHLFLTDSAAYMKKCYCEVLHPIMPQLIHIPCCAHILNLIGDTWRVFNHFSVIKTLLEKVKEKFTRSPARRRRYMDHLQFHRVNQPQKIPLPCKTRWNSWFQMVNYTKDHLIYWPGFFQAE